MAGGKSKATCRPALLGERRHFFMLPRCVVDSPAYRDLSVHARAVLIEIGVRLDGFNNGKIGCDQRSMMESLRCRPANIVKAIAELMTHGLIDVSAEGDRLAKKAREYRLTFVSTPTAPATNDYLRWTPTPEKSGATTVVTGKPTSATTVVTKGGKPATDVVTERIKSARKTAVFDPEPATTVVSHISKPYGGAERPGSDPSIIAPLLRAAEIGATESRCCEQCGNPVPAGGRGPHVKRFCGEFCRRVAERERARARQRSIQAQTSAR